jgi:predicted nucleotidyltransferase component of viral defense system
MLDAETIKRLSRLRGLKPWQEEKRYIQSLILFSLRDQPLVLKGGTYLWLFHSLYRFSDDLDFSLQSKFGKDREELLKNVSDTLNMFGVANSIKVIKDDRYVLSFRVDSAGPLFTSIIDLCRVYVELSKREQLLLPPVSVKLDEPDYALPIIYLKGMDLEEVAAEKVRAIIRRKKARDVYDLWFLVSRKKVKASLEMINKKLSFYGSSFNKDTFLAAVKATANYWQAELSPIIIGDLPPFEEVLNVLRYWV